MPAWHVLVPFRPGPGAKSRLSPQLDAPARAALALTMAQHVMAELALVPDLASLSMLSPDALDWWHGDRVVDRGRGLNPELEAWRAGLGGRATLVLHADLPLLRAADVVRMLALATTHGVALATDRAGTGSNALAIADGRPFAYRFGPDSRALHAAQVPGMPVLTDTGLIADVDTPDDLAAVNALATNQPTWSGPEPKFAQ